MATGLGSANGDGASFQYDKCADCINVSTRLHWEDRLLKAALALLAR